MKFHGSSVARPNHGYCQVLEVHQDWLTRQCWQVSPDDAGPPGGPGGKALGGPEGPGGPGREDLGGPGGPRGPGGPGGFLCATAFRTSLGDW